ncbi:MAG: hypothetical protein WCX28_06385 [Bacteriovoracaceae bacterium]|nr:hypothetical protein [Bacteroidota bacterium]
MIQPRFYYILWIAVFSQAILAQDEELSFTLDRQETKSVVTLHSIKKFPCRNYRMDTRDYENADTIIIIIRDFIPPTPCDGPRDVAKEQFILQPSAKRFYLKLWYKGKYDKWRIFQLDTAYLVRPEGVTFSSYTEPIK